MNSALIFSTGLVFLSALALSAILRNFKIPSVTSYVVLGIILGPLAFNIISPQLIQSSDIISTVALSIIAFSLGQNFSKENFKQMGKDLVVLSLAQSIGSAALVGSGVFIFTGDILLSVALASVSATTSPTSIVMAVRELKIKGRFPEMLMGTVAMSDLWGLVLFAFALAAVRTAAGENGAAFAFASGAGEILGALAFGVFMGWILSLFSKIITRKSELLILTLGFVLFNTGVSLFLSLSTLLSAMAMSAAVVNFDPTSFKFFNSLRNVDTPLYLLFFVLAGSKLQLAGFSYLSQVGGIYIVFRVVGKIAGVKLGGIIASVPRKVSRNLGLALSPQAGVALGLAIVMASAYPDPAGGRFILSVIVASTIIFEIFGPFLTRYALLRSRRH